MHLYISFQYKSTAMILQFFKGLIMEFLGGFSAFLEFLFLFKLFPPHKDRKVRSRDSLNKSLESIS